MLSILIKVGAFGLPAIIALCSAVIGSRQVRFLREKTGDNSTLTHVLSGAIFHDTNHDRAA